MQYSDNKFWKKHVDEHVTITDCAKIFGLHPHTLSSRLEKIIDSRIYEKFHVWKFGPKREQPILTVDFTVGDAIKDQTILKHYPVVINNKKAI